jgi:hypothetical protein
MPRYFFDTRDGADFVRDEIGIELDGVEAARDEATRGLADFARDALPGSVRRELAVECRDEGDHDVLRAALWFEVAVLQGKPGLFSPPTAPQI